MKNYRLEKYRGYFYKILLSLFFLIIFLRTGIYPMSGGDNMWFSESAYWLINDGILKHGILPDSNANVITYGPPVISFFQALIFKLFGLNFFTTMLQGTIHFFLFYLSSFLILRIKKIEFYQSLLASVLFFLSLNLDTVVLHNRPENLSYIFFIFAIYILLKSLNRKNNLLSFFSGFLFSLSVVSYYPLAPVIIISLIFFLYIFKIKISQFFILILGSLIIGIVFIIWILKDFNIFYDQSFNKENVSFYLNIFSSIKNFFYSLNLKNLEYAIFVILNIITLNFSKDKFVKFLTFTSLVSFIIYLLFQNFNYSPFIIMPSILGFIIFVYKEVILNKNYLKIKRYLNLLIIFIIFFKVIILIFISITQYQERSYFGAIAILDKYKNIKGKVGITQYAWLPTRKLYKFNQLLAMPNYSGNPQVLPFISKIFFDKKAINEFDMFIVVKNDPSLKINYPLVYKNINSDLFKEVDSYKINKITYVIYIKSNL
jgi:hypothetical protein